MQSKISAIMNGNAAKIISGAEASTGMHGRPDQLTAFREAVLATKSLIESINADAKIEDIQEALMRKKIAADEFKRTTGIDWAL